MQAKRCTPFGVHFKPMDIQIRRSFPVLLGRSTKLVLQFKVPNQQAHVTWLIVPNLYKNMVSIKNRKTSKEEGARVF